MEEKINNVLKTMKEIINEVENWKPNENFTLKDISKHRVKLEDITIDLMLLLNTGALLYKASNKVVEKINKETTEAESKKRFAE